MVPVSLYDEVIVEETSTGISVEVTDPAIPADARNSCHRAAVLFREWAGAPRGIRVRIRKTIPPESGLGGGSSDAAATLKGLVALTGKTIPRDTLLSLAASIGADVPFFTLGRPALVEGFGDVLTPLDWHVPFHAVIVKPAFGLPTREGFERLGRTEDDPPDMRDPPSFRGWEDLVSAVENDFESVWEKDRPDIPDIKEALRKAGAEAAGLSGSGSSVFGLFRSGEDARKAEKRLGNGKGRNVFVARNI